LQRPVDKSDWPYSCETVNASYDPLLKNNITFPAGILQPPFYDNNADDAMNFGGIGAVIGHELTHGFDDEGSQFDAQGNLRDWWTAERTKSAFKERHEMRQSASNSPGYTSAPRGHVKLKGDLTLGENVATMGGFAVICLNGASYSMRGPKTGTIDGHLYMVGAARSAFPGLGQRAGAKAGPTICADAGDHLDPSSPASGA